MTARLSKGQEEELAGLGDGDDDVAEDDALAISKLPWRMNPLAMEKLAKMIKTSAMMVPSLMMTSATKK